MALPEVTREMLDRYPSEGAALMSLGYLPGSRLGVGGSAQVFSVINTLRPEVLVAKVTMDEGDAKRLNHFMHLQSLGLAQNVVRVFGVYKVGWTYLVLTERLHPFTREQITAWVETGAHINDVAKRPFTPGFWRYSSGPRGSKERIQRNLEILNIPGMHHDLSLAGYSSHTDWHEMNVMDRPGHGPVLLDLGGMA